MSFTETGFPHYRSGQTSSQSSGVDVIDSTAFEGAGSGGGAGNGGGGDALPESYVTASHTNVMLCLKNKLVTTITIPFD